MRYMVTYLVEPGEETYGENEEGWNIWSYHTNRKQANAAYRKCCKEWMYVKLYHLSVLEEQVDIGDEG